MKIYNQLKIFILLLDIPFFLWLILLSSITYIYLFLECFSGDTKTQVLIYNLSESYISAFVFYIIVSAFPAYRQKILIKKNVDIWINRITSDLHCLLLSMSKKSNVNIEKYWPAEKELTDICKTINPKDVAPITCKNGSQLIEGNWFQYFLYNRDRTIKHLDRIDSRSQFLDIKLIELIDNIRYNSFFETLDLTERIPLNNKNLENFYISIKEYIDKVKELEKHL